MLVENRDFFHTPLHSTPVRGVPVGISSEFGVGKLEWLGYPMVKKL